jgi:hypothetical protein
MSEEKDRKFENEEPEATEAEDVEAHYKGGKLANAEDRDYKGGKLANDEGDGGDDVEAHFKSGKL